MTTPARSSSLAWLALLVSGLLYGYNWVVMKSALRYENSATFAASRVFGGAVFLFLLVLILRRPLRPKNWLLTILVGLFGMTGGIGLIVWALASGDAGKTSVLFYTMPVWLLLMSWIILGERVRGFQWISVGIAVVGMGPCHLSLEAGGHRAQQPAGRGSGRLLGGQRCRGQVAFPTRSAR